VERRKFDEGPRELTSFSEEMLRYELAPTSRLLAQDVVEADAKVADALAIPLKAPVFTLRRVRLAGGEPTSVQTAHIPAALAPGIAIAENASLYEVLQNRYSLYAARARETYYAGTADQGVAELLEIAAGSPVFKVERVTVMPNERPFEFVQSVVRGDRYTIVLELEKRGGARADMPPSALRPYRVGGCAES
jgi:GntR family transcriptional regulator